MEPKEIQDVREMLEDVIESVRNVHGQDFTNFVMLMTTAAQLQTRIAALREAALDPEHNQEKEYFVRRNAEVVQTLLASMCANIGNICGLEDEKLQEGLDWSSKIVDMAYSKFENLQ